MTVTAIFYRAPGDWRDRSIRCLTGSIYSHCELVGRRLWGSTYETVGASKRDGNQVRVQQLDIASGSWDALTFPGHPDEAWARVEPLIGQPYDTLGALLSATAMARPREGRWFCSELIAHAIGMREPHEFSPGMLAAAAIGAEG